MSLVVGLDLVLAVEERVEVTRVSVSIVEVFEGVEGFALIVLRSCFFRWAVCLFCGVCCCNLFLLRGTGIRSYR